MDVDSLWWLLIPLPIFAVLFLPKITSYPAILLGFFTYAFVIRGGQDTSWFLNLTLIALMLTCVSVITGQLRGEIIRFRLTWYDLLVVSLFVMMFLGILYSPSQELAMVKTARFGVLVVLPFFLARVVLISQRRVRMLAVTVLSIALAVAGIILVSRLAPGFLPDFMVVASQGETRLQFVGANPVPVATLFTVGVIIALALPRREQKLIFGFPFAALLVYAIFLTGTRSPALALGAVGTIFVASVFVLNPTRGTLLILLGTLALAIIISTASFESLPNWDRYELALTDRSADRSIQERNQLQEEAIAMFQANPIVGGGTAALSGYPHNIFLELASELGIFGVAAMAGLVLLVFGRTWTFLFTRRITGEERDLAMLIILSFIALLVIKQFSFGLTAHKDMFIFLAAIVNLPLIFPDTARRKRSSESTAAKSTYRGWGPVRENSKPPLY